MNWWMNVQQQDVHQNVWACLLWSILRIHQDQVDELRGLNESFQRHLQGTASAAGLPSCDGLTEAESLAP